MSKFFVNTIGIARTPFNEKFGIPRQPGLVDLPAVIELQSPYNREEAVNGLEQVSHIWLHFIFSEHVNAEHKLTVRPPRLGGNKRLGVFATRSSYRPNSIGQSLVRLEGIQQGENGVELHVSGIDLLDGTPIIDIKPYLPYADIIKEASNGLASQAPGNKPVVIDWHKTALEQLYLLKGDKSTQIKRWLTEILQLDPRPAYKRQKTGEEYTMAMFDLDVHWEVKSDNHIEVVSVEVYIDKVSNRI